MVGTEKGAPPSCPRPNVTTGPVFGGQVTLSEIERVKPWAEGERVYFPTRDHPLDTAPGASAVYHLLVVPPSVQQATWYNLHLRMASERTNGFTEKKLRLKILPASVKT